MSDERVRFQPEHRATVYFYHSRYFCPRSLKVNDCIFAEIGVNYYILLNDCGSKDFCSRFIISVVIRESVKGSRCNSALCCPHTVFVCLTVLDLCYNQPLCCFNLLFVVICLSSAVDICACSFLLISPQASLQTGALCSSVTVTGLFKISTVLLWAALTKCC